MRSNLKKEIAALRKRQAVKSLKDFALLYLPHHVLLKPSRAHGEIYELLFRILEKRGSKIVIAAPRGFGKSTLVTILFVLYVICFRREAFIVILSHTSSQAYQILENIKRELMDNKRLLEDFPELAGQRPRPWTREEIEVPNHVRIAAFGMDQGVRGRRYGKHRPTLVIADDIEDADKNFNHEEKEKQKRKFEQAILEVGSSETNYLLIGNYYHPDSLIGDYINPQMNPRWIKQIYRAVVSWPTNQKLWEKWSLIYNSKEKHKDDTGPEAAKAFYLENESAMLEGVEVLWPSRWTFYELMEKYEDNPVKFNAEYQNAPVNPKECYFTPDAYHYWDDRHKTLDDFLLAMEGRLDFFGACDPSMGKDKTKGDYTAIAIIGRDRKDGRLYHILSDISRCEVHETIDNIIAYHRRFHFSRFAVESNQFQGLILTDLIERSRKQNAYIRAEELKNQTDKLKRIQSTQPLFKSGTVQLNHMNKLFNEEVRYFPRGRYDDGLDALEMAIRIAEDRQVRAFICGGGGDDSGWGTFSRAVRGR